MFRTPYPIQIKISIFNQLKIFNSLLSFLMTVWPPSSLLVQFFFFFFFFSFFLDLRKHHPPESALYGPRWASKTPTVPGSYKRYTPWLELETYCADLNPFAITPRPLRTSIFLVNPLLTSVYSIYKLLILNGFLKF